MRLLRVLPAMVVLIGFAGGETTGASTPVSYGLLQDSGVEIGCQPPCQCPVLIRSPLAGSFELVFVASDGLFDTYDVTNLDWTVSGNPPLHYRGAGTYRVGGEFAAQHQLTLALIVNGQFLQRFDSGLVIGGGSFPILEIPVAANGFFCFDTVLTVHAAPDRAGSPRDPGPRLTLLGPNPFRTHIGIAFDLTTPAPVDLAVYDVQGRLVRRLFIGTPAEAGTQAIRWDGRNAAGAESPPGTYFLRLQAPGRSQAKTLIKVP